MDFLSELWSSWNAGLGTAVATIMAVIALLRSTAKDFHQLLGAVSRWRAWTIISGLYAKAKTLYRKRRAEIVMRRALQGKSVEMGIQVYANCLGLDPNESSRSQLEAITPSSPSWLNDYYVVAALESLSNDESVVKSERYPFDTWPPDPVRYVFHINSSDIPARDQAVAIETNEKCKVCQHFDLCPREPRFYSRSSAETVSARETRFTTTFTLKSGAEPCDLCWEKEGRERDVRMLVESISTYDLADLISIDIGEANEEFRAAVAAACIEGQCAADPEVVRSVVRHAIGIRKAQIERSASMSPHEWQEGERSNLIRGLCEFLNRDRNE